MQDILPAIVFSSDLFLLITYLGISVYLVYLFRNWDEPTIGGWAFGSSLCSISIGLHMLSIRLLNIGNPNFDTIYRLSVFVFYLAAYFFGLAHPIARRDKFDLMLTGFISIPLGFLLPSILQDLELQVLGGLIFEQFSSTFTTFDLLNFAFFGFLFIIFARDSQLIYNASLRNAGNSYRKSIAMGHLFAWQFFAVGSGFLRYIAKFLETPVYFGLPFILLLVPLLTLGSRPFDWAREGHEPVLLLLIDQYGTPTYSWTKSATTPLFMQGSTMASVTSMLEDLMEDKVKSMEVSYERFTLYTQQHMNYLSLLITTGSHQSFPRLLEKIHMILVTDSIKQESDGLVGYKFPSELEWLLNQLIPDHEFTSESGTIKSLLEKSGVNFFG